MGRRPTSKRRASFFKVLLGDFKEMLRIPPAFMKYFRGQLPVKFVLRCSNERFWYVEAKRISSYLFFENGWRKFVNENLLEIGDFLVFQYDGDMEFDVKIFGRSGCEKEAVSTERKFDECSLSEGKEDKQNEEGEFVDQTSGCRCNSYLSRLGKWVPSSKTTCERIQSEQKPTLGVAADYCPFKIRHPHFVITYTGKRYQTSIPTTFAIENGLRDKQYVYLHDHDGKTWKVNIVNLIDGRCFLGSGWWTFTKEHNLSVGDVCGLEFIRGRGRGTRRMIRIHIFRASE